MKFTRNKPQMTVQEIYYVKQLSKNHGHIIEFGSGLSTIEWAKSFDKVTSIETRIEWFKKIRGLALKNYNNIQVIFAPPESCAYGDNGEELWNFRDPSDCGLKNEFQGCLVKAKNIIENQTEPCVIFIDANVRTEILMLALDSELKHNILIHDVIPERDYLNPWINELNKNIVHRIDSLIHVIRA